MKENQISCATCMHNSHRHDICWMWGIPPDNQGTFGFAEKCQYYQLELPKQKTVWEEIYEGFEYTPQSIKVKRETLEKLIEAVGGEKGFSEVFSTIFSTLMRNEFGHIPNKLFEKINENETVIDSIVNDIMTHDYVGVEWEIKIITTPHKSEGCSTYISLQAKHHANKQYTNFFLVDKNEKVVNFHFSKRGWSKFSFENFKK